MKRLIVSTIVALGLAGTVVAAYKLPLSYRKVYCYPTGTYWQKQVAAYPDYYAANDAYYTAQYGATTIYCPNH